MREIKFRAWNVKDKRWLIVEEIVIDAEDGEILQLDLAEDRYFGLPSTVPRVLMQYTGLKDKNGVEIYEGDIVRETSKESDEKAIGAVYFSQEGGCWFVGYGKLGRYPLASRDFYGLEVIGNIYENPELLEAK